MQTLPANNLIILILYCQLFSKLHCTKCGEALFRKHGFHQRYKIYFCTEKVNIQRFYCLKPGCKGTFSLKPVPLLPYCRFSLWHLVQIDELLKSGDSSYNIAQSLDIPISVILRIKSYLTRVQTFIHSEWRICGNFTVVDFLRQWIGIMKRHTWFGLTHKYFHALYPLRV